MEMNNDRWRNKIALISGGSSGIGLAIAKWLAVRGAWVWLAARRVKLLEEALNSLPNSGPQRHGIVPADVADAKEAAKTVAKVTQEVGLPDLLINSAGITQPGYVHELDIDQFHSLMQVNYFGTVHLTKAALPGMMARRSGHIVNISSIAGFLGVFGYSAYGASKYAVRGFSDTLRVEMKPHGIRVSIVFPPDTQTPQFEYERPFLPPELKVLNPGHPLPVHQVADEIMRRVSRNKYIILPGSQPKLYFYLSGVIGPSVYPIMDWLVRRARRHSVQLKDQDQEHN